MRGLRTRPRLPPSCAGDCPGSMSAPGRSTRPTRMTRTESRSWLTAIRRPWESVCRMCGPRREAGDQGEAPSASRISCLMPASGIRARPTSNGCAVCSKEGPLTLAPFDRASLQPPIRAAGLSQGCEISRKRAQSRIPKGRERNGSRPGRGQGVRLATRLCTQAEAAGAGRAVLADDQG